MADGYGTGMSSRPVDFASPGLAFFNSAIQARKQEIGQHMAEAANNEKLMLKALDVKNLGDVSGEARRRLDKDISSFRQDMISRYQKTQGKLSSSDRQWMESKAIDIQNNINTTKNQLQAIAKAKEIVQKGNPAMYKDFEGMLVQLGKDEEAIGRGDLMVNPMNTIMSYIAPPTPEQILADQVKKANIKFDTAPVKTDNGDGTFSVTNKLTETGKQQFRDWASKNPQVMRQFTTIGKDGIPVYDEEAQDRAMENMFGETGTIRVKSRSGSGSGGDSFANDIPTVDMVLGGKTFNIAKLDTPKTMTGLPSDGVNVITGKKVPAGGTQLTTFIGPGKDDQGNPILLFTSKTPGTTSPVLIGGKVAYKGQTDMWKEKNPMTLDDIEENPAQVFKDSGGDPKATSSDGRRYDSYTYKVVKNGDAISIVAYGHAPYEKNTWKKDKPELTEEAGSIPLSPAMDKDAVDTVAVPLTRDNFGYFTGKLGKKKINGIPADQFLQGLITGTKQQAAPAGKTKEDEFLKQMGL